VSELMKCLNLDGNKTGTRGHCLKLRKTRCTKDIDVFSNKVADRWNLLDQQTVDDFSLNILRIS